MKVTIDKNSGFCFGVEFAIQMAEDELDESGSLYCLGDIVHNDVEVGRLNARGLKVIDHDDLKELKDCKVLIRAHGEPPETYRIAMENNITIIDASCPVVLKLQNRIKDAYDDVLDLDGQIVIYGKKGHAEVTGLNGQTKSNAIIISSEDDLEKIDFERPVVLFSQTTKSTGGFYKIKNLIEERLNSARTEKESTLFLAHDSICRQVSNRDPHLVKFSKEFDIILFVSSKKSSNGKALYNVCLENNNRSYFIEDENDLNSSWFHKDASVGICGATSTPMWLMEKVSDRVKNFL